MFSALRKALRKLSLRLTLWHALIFLAAALVMSTLSYILIKERLDVQQRNLLNVRVNLYAEVYEREGLAGVRRRAALIKGRDQQAYFVRMGDAQNHTNVLRDPEDWAEFAPEKLAAQSIPPPGSKGWTILKAPSGVELLVAYRCLSDGSIIQFGKSNEEMRDVLAGVRAVNFGVLFVFLPASIAAGAFLASRALRPVQSLTTAAERIVATGKFDARVPSRGTGDELDALVHLFNQMLTRIDRLIQGMSDSVDNVAHDLRTPMTRLKQKAQAALELEVDLEQTRDALADCVEEADRVMTLLNTLMDIAETESGLVEFTLVPVDLAEVIDYTVDSYSEVAEEKGIEVRAEVPKDWCVAGDAHALRRVFANLLDNAIKYTPQGGRVRIAAERQGAIIAVHFSDTGIGIAPGDLPRVWDRLFRGDRSRSERGLGLGLSFVQAIVQSHRGSVTAASELGVGTNVTVKLPAAKEPAPPTPAPGALEAVGK